MGEHSPVHNAIAGPCRLRGFASESRCVFVFMCVSVARLPRGVWSRCASVSFTHSTRAHCLLCSACSTPILTHTLCLYVFFFFFCSVHIVLFEPWAFCGSLWRKKVFLAFVCVRQAVYPLCLHLFIVCTHLAGDTNSLSEFLLLCVDMQVITSRRIVKMCDFRLSGGLLALRSPESTLE